MPALTQSSQRDSITHIGPDTARLSRPESSASFGLWLLQL